MSSSTSGDFLSVVGTYTIDPQDASAFAKIATESVAQIVGKAGCLYYTASRDLAQPNVFHLSEGWADQAALDEHAASPEFTKMLQQAMKLRILGREIYVSQSKGRTLVS